MSERGREISPTQFRFMVNTAFELGIEEGRKAMPAPDCHSGPRAAGGFAQEPISAGTVARAREMMRRGMGLHEAAAGLGVRPPDLDLALWEGLARCGRPAAREAQNFEPASPAKPPALAIRPVRADGRLKSSITPPASWPRVTLDPGDRVLIETMSWKAFPLATVIAVAEAWNGGMDTAAMALDLQCSPHSLRMLIGPLRQLGVWLRPADHTVKAERRIADRQAAREPTPTPAPVVGEDAQIARLRKMAPFDSLARRALESMGIEP